MRKKPGTAGSTRARICERRRKGRQRAAKLCADAQAAVVARGEPGCTDRAIGARFDVDHSAVGPWFDPESGVALALGDVLALPRPLARESLVRALAELDDGDGPDPEAAMGDLAIKLGAIAQGIAADRADDGRINDHARHRDAFAAAMAVAMRGYLAASRRADGGAR